MLSLRFTTVLLFAFALPQILASGSDEYFWNELTGDVQWEDPGGVPHIVGGKRVWYDAQGNLLEEDPNAMDYLWVESFSEEHGRPFFFNQKTQTSTWERPADLAWRRVKVGEVEDEL